jgi:hypothetical protein
MKRDLIKTLLNRGKSLDNSIKKKLLIGVGVIALLGFFTAALIGYFGVKAAGYLISNAPTQDQFGALTEQLGEQGNVLLTTTKVASCIDVVQSHMNLNPWLTRPVSVNVANIYGTCIGKTVEEKVLVEEQQGE